MCCWLSCSLSRSSRGASSLPMSLRLKTLSIVPPVRPEGRPNLNPLRMSAGMESSVMPARRESETSPSVASWLPSSAVRSDRLKTLLKLPVLSKAPPRLLLGAFPLPASAFLPPAPFLPPPPSCARPPPARASARTPCRRAGCRSPPGPPGSLGSPAPPAARPNPRGRSRPWRRCPARPCPCPPGGARRRSPPCLPPPCAGGRPAGRCRACPSRWGRAAARGPRHPPGPSAAPGPAAPGGG